MEPKSLHGGHGVGRSPGSGGKKKSHGTVKFKEYLGYLQLKYSKRFYVKGSGHDLQEIIPGSPYLEC